MELIEGKGGVRFRPRSGVNNLSLPKIILLFMFYLFMIKGKQLSLTKIILLMIFYLIITKTLDL
tara:strand:- start:373 stop:564 length:192 start_codon:yes stop_codon:yes gene_type:complete